ncbi:MAG TPA: hypothetical protein VL418_01570 [Devosiaceae bacterium]|nr:hypothetical protein [Devosiaceae bacterium]
MAAAKEERERVSGAIQRAMRTAVAQHCAVPVREVARSIIAETHSDPEMFEDVLDTLCALCIRSGLTIEFTRPLTLGETGSGRDLSAAPL